ncbi:homologous recombination [Teratosphaeria destructans]|uniref:Homologous recombination n=1 Tax=Teratosphaeria destructans TaxID=418781 RepID=A0A9W7SZ67_9PEZI|nr:homologous recombination [Teratosphaeria destructans]
MRVRVRSERVLRDQYLQPPSEPGEHSLPAAQEDSYAQEDSHARRKVAATLYDAVAGRVGYESFLSAPTPSKFRDRSSASQVAVPPEEVLFRRRNAPVRYEEDDIYAADRDLTPEQGLPESELLKEVHAYVSDFYKSLGEGGDVSFQSFDETALIAMGILLEEAANESLGRTGDLAFVEAEDEDVEDGSRTYWHEGRRKRKVLVAERKRKKRVNVEDVEVEKVVERVDDDEPARL